jgi:hypothetical protein
MFAIADRSRVQPRSDAESSLSSLLDTSISTASMSTSSSYFKTANYVPDTGSHALVQIADKAVHYSKEFLVSRSWTPLVVLGPSSPSYIHTFVR